MEFFTEFPEMGRQDLRDFKKGIDASFREFSRTYGEGIENFLSLYCGSLSGWKNF